MLCSCHLSEGRVLLGVQRVSAPVGDWDGCRPCYSARRAVARRSPTCCRIRSPLCGVKPVRLASLRHVPSLSCSSTGSARPCCALEPVTRDT
ncbi:hypothetical protein ACFPRL_00790 [Pseudoclavibacter helvolus]